MISNILRVPETLLMSIPASAWKYVPMANEVSHKGVHLVEISYINVLISDKGCWCFVRDNDLFDVCSEHSLMPILPILEVGCELFKEKIEKSLNAQNISLELVNTFPVSAFISTAIKIESDYWSKLSIDWLKCYRINDDIKSDLQNIINAPWASQQTRHMAKRAYFNKI